MAFSDNAFSWVLKYTPILYKDSHASHSSRAELLPNLLGSKIGGVKFFQDGTLAFDNPAAVLAALGGTSATGFLPITGGTLTGNVFAPQYLFPTVAGVAGGHISAISHGIVGSNGGFFQADGGNDSPFGGSPGGSFQANGGFGIIPGWILSGQRRP